MKNIRLINSGQIAIIITMCLSLLVFTSCDESEDVVADDAGIESLSVSELSELSIASESAADDVMEDIDDLAQDAVSDIDNISNARRGSGFGDRDCVERTVERDTVDEVVTTTITLEFDGDCISERGKRIRDGKIIIVKVGDRNEPGSTHTLTLEDFFVDSVQVEGVRTYENLSSEEDETVKTITATLVGGKLTFPDATFATREATTTRVKDSEKETVTVTGEASGVSREGADYSMTITEALVFDKTCEDTFIPVTGIKEIVKDGVETIKNYGNGTCDNLVDVTRDGTTETVEVESRKRFPKARNLFLKRRGNKG